MLRLDYLNLKLAPEIGETSFTHPAPSAVQCLPVTCAQEIGVC